MKCTVILLAFFAAGCAFPKTTPAADSALYDHPWWSDAPRARIDGLIGALQTTPSVWIFNDRAECVKCSTPISVHTEQTAGENWLRENIATPEAAKHEWKNWGMIHIASLHAKRYTRAEIVAMLKAEIERLYFLGKK